MLTIYMRAYNEEQHIATAIQSLLNQTFKDFIIFVENNASTDSTGEIIETFAKHDSRIKPYHRKANEPFSVNFLDLVNTPYYMFAAGHDFYSPHFMEKCMARIQEDPRIVLAYPKAMWMKGDRILGAIPSVFETVGIDPMIRALLVALGLVEAYQSYGIFRTEALKLTNIREVVGTDHVFLAELSMLGTFALVDEHLFFMRQGDSWGDVNTYRKKHWPKEPDGIGAFLKMANAYMKIADKTQAPLDQMLLKTTFFTISLLRYRGILNMFGESIESLFARPGFEELSGTMSDMLRLIEENIQTECVEKTSSPSQPIFEPAPPTPNKSKIRIAGEGELGKDLTKIQEGSTFENALSSLVKSVRPQSIIETGTYLGTGTTRIIASALRDAGLTETRFFTIECNPVHHHHAVNNLAQSGLSAFVTPLLGLSVPRSVLPDMEKIQEETVTNIEGDNIFVDHQEANRVSFYYRETDFPDIQEDLLGNCLNKLEGRPSIVLLDSAGHLGNVEFNYLTGKLKGECYVVLDDVYHIKHHKSLQQIKRDPRFTLITSSDEKFGFCIVKFNPRAEVESPVKKNRILWVRTDSIGDNILAMAMLPHLKTRRPDAEIIVFCQEHIADLYEACPVVDRVITFNRIRALQDEGYRTAILHQIQGLQADICLNSVYSREPLTDFFAAGSGALERIALQGDCSNISMEDLMNNNRLYTSIVSTANGRKPELERHQDFLRGIGITGEKLEPTMWLHPDDITFSDRFFKEHGLEPEKTIALFAGAQHSVRLYEKYGTALAQICRENGFSVVAFGSVNDYGINQQNLDAIGETTVNLSGTTTLLQSAALLSRCRLAVGAETGLAHTACAVGTPNVILLGGGHFGRFMPYSPLTSVACLPLECYGCNWQCRHTRVHCVRDVKPVVIEEAIRQTLSGMSVKPRVFVQDASNRRIEVGEPRWADMNEWLVNGSVSIIPVT